MSFVLSYFEFVTSLTSFFRDVHYEFSDAKDQGKDLPLYTSNVRVGKERPKLRSTRYLKYAELLQLLSVNISWVGKLLPSVFASGRRLTFLAISTAQIFVFHGYPTPSSPADGFAV